MSKSVTVIRGRVWTRQSVTRDRNVPSGNVLEGGSDGDRHGRDHHEGRRGRGHDPNHGDSPDDAPDGEWDLVQEGRTFTRRVQTT